MTFSPNKDVFINHLQNLVSDEENDSDNLIYRCHKFAIGRGVQFSEWHRRLLRDQFQATSNVYRARVLVSSMSKIDFYEAFSLSEDKPAGISPGLEHFLRSCLFSLDLPKEKDPQKRLFRSHMAADYLYKCLDQSERERSTDSLLLSLAHALIDAGRIDEAGGVLTSFFSTLTYNLARSAAESYMQGICYLKKDFDHVDEHIEWLIDEKSVGPMGPYIYSVWTLMNIGRADLAAKSMTKLIAKNTLMRRKYVEILECMGNTDRIDLQILYNLYGHYYL